MNGYKSRVIQLGFVIVSSTLFATSSLRATDVGGGLGNPKDPGDDNACYAGGSKQGQCHTEWDWNAGWYRIRVERGDMSYNDVPDQYKGGVPQPFVPTAQPHTALGNVGNNPTPSPTTPTTPPQVPPGNPPPVIVPPVAVSDIFPAQTPFGGNCIISGNVLDNDFVSEGTSLFGTVGNTVIDPIGGFTAILNPGESPLGLYTLQNSAGSSTATVSISCLPDSVTFP
ncbi:MAG: hypothetical protein R3E39_07975 [Anaerolineae bacterium]